MLFCLLTKLFELPLLLPSGMGQYLRTFSDHLSMHNTKSLLLLRRALSSFYGRQNFVHHLQHLGSKAITRSVVNQPQRNRQIVALAIVGKVRCRNLRPTSINFILLASSFIFVTILLFTAHKFINFQRRLTCMATFYDLMLIIK